MKRRCYCMNTFEFDGKKYKMASIHQKEWGNTLISELKLKGDERILDCTGLKTINDCWKMLIKH